jgi:protein-L-isoaspartate(D-aspartate) O-methyltransferase
MVRRQIAGRGLSNSRVLAAMASVPRDRFVPDDVRHLAHADQPLPIGFEQTISQPYIVALMTDLAHIGRNSKVLEVGTGSGYHTAVLAKIARHVWSVERIGDLSRLAEQRLLNLEIENITLVVGDGARGYPEAAPYDAIIVAAAAPHSPRPLLEQLAIGGHLVIPLGDRAIQVMYTLERTSEGYVEHASDSCRFVPLLSPDAFEV